MEYSDILDEYLKVFPDESDRQKKLRSYLVGHKHSEVIDWNNFEGHIVASGFIYAKKTKKFLVLYHRDLDMFLYPGGHVEETDADLLAAAKREVVEETGIKNFEVLKITEKEIIPFDIDTHKIAYNVRLDLPEHYHFDFRYLFVVDEWKNVVIDKNEHAEYKWIDIDELALDKNYGNIVAKLKKMLR